MKNFYFEINDLYKKSKNDAIYMLEKKNLDIRDSLKYLTIPVLKDAKLWNEEIKDQISKYNTSKFYTNYQILSIKYNLLEYLNTNIKDTNNLLLLDFCMYFKQNIYNINLIPYISKLSKNRLFTINFIKLLDVYEILKNEYNLEFHNFLSFNDIDLTIKYLKHVKNPSNFFITKVKYSEWCKYKKYIDENFIKKYFYKFNINDLLLIKDEKLVWELYKNLNFKSRYILYKKLKFNVNIQKIINMDLKNLVNSNYDLLIAKYKLHIKDALNIIKVFIDNLIIFPVQMELLSKIINGLSNFHKDIFIYYILNRLNNTNFINKYTFNKEYVRISKFIGKIDYDTTPIKEFINMYIKNKRFSIILLMNEIQYKASFDYNEIWLYENCDIKLKDEIFEMYLKMHNLTPKNKNQHIKYLTLYEVDKLQNFIFDYDYIEEYIYVRNIARFVSNNIDQIVEFDKIIIFFTSCSLSEMENIKLIGNSMLSKISVFVSKKSF
ncbi:hypothetical protein NAPIS_ORF02167 [Vairimorpha apis BRL 01]|uniref:Uncharacterized protein n=1 Tax=Vairimorpha apis BRL 01 TaxID=1037528 RepID=T0L6Y1_9MICR|nr:hypothetical protein NAPIS_ORF02167 [Vairimorpha apis BRL 01]